MPFAAALSTAFPGDQAAREVARSIRSSLGGKPELAVAFYSPHHAADVAELAHVLWEELGAKSLTGVLGESIVGGSREIEDRPALSVWAANWNGSVGIDAFHLDLEETPDGPTLFGWPDAILEADPASSLLLCFGDPYSFPAVDLFLPRVNEDHPGLVVAGGMASSPIGPQATPLFLDGEIKEKGAVAVLLRGVPFQTVVSQGCRPVGRSFVVTKCEDNVIQELGGVKPLDYLRTLLEEVPAHDKDLMQRGLLIGVAVSEYRDEFRRGDFLIRNLIGLDPRTGALAVTDRIRLGQTVQFQVRDAATADEDLGHLLQSAKASGFQPGGGLLFSCNGRGTRMFAGPDHDAKAVQQEAGPLALAGFFAAGELGPIGGKNFIHGFTASAVLFAEKN
jgi:small ligand-binding sensory domain FIST